LLGRDEDVALEATQEAFAKAWARWRRLRDEEWIVGWLVKVALNEVRDLSRRAARRNATERQPERPQVDADLLDLRVALLQLPRRRREALVLFYITDLSITSVAHVMDVSVGTVKAHLSQGREALRLRLEDRHE
jgi:RNA polymerase sigma-70 factor, ECF subfamily